MDKGKAIEKVKAYSRLLKKHIAFENIYLFGSYATNTQHTDSDIDVAVVVKQIEGDFFSVHPVLWKLRRQIDDRIEPVLIEKDKDYGGFLIEIRRNGIKIT